uniref:Uncharacterized protein n=1 Tax=Salmonella sp. TaxID=599 RepID=A0A482EUH6_SALSP|nr:host cell division inhibitor Icd-like protein [Salmonella sp.]QBM91484.1 hypothetical protein NNIBIDOC_00155 [Salmonella sp.]
MVNANPCPRRNLSGAFIPAQNTYISVMLLLRLKARSFLPTDPCIFAARFKPDALDVLTYWNAAQ